MKDKSSRLAKLSAKPQSAARPLGTKKGKKTEFKSGAEPVVVEQVVVEPTEAPKVSLASIGAPVVPSSQLPSATDKNNTGVQQDAPTGKDIRIMTLTYKGLSKSGKFALYSGLRTVTRMSITDFPDSKPVPSFEVSGNFAGPREKKPKMTAEERKAYRLAHPKPKLTLAELIAKREKALEALKAKAAQPELVTA